MYITDAIILKKDPIGEADCLVMALTAKYVRIRLVAQGARKVEAKLKGHLEPFSLSRLSFVAGKNNYRLVGAELLQFFPNIKNDSERLRIAAEIIQMLDRALFEDRAEGDKAFFDITREAFIALDDISADQKDCERILAWFQIRFLEALGFLPYTERRGIPSYADMSFPRLLQRDDMNRIPEYEFRDMRNAVAHLIRVHLEN